MDKGKTFNVNLPDEHHAAIRQWCFANDETVMEFCRTATIQRMYKERITPNREFTPSQKVNTPEHEEKHLTSIEEVLIKYNALLLDMPVALPDKRYGGTIRVKIKEGGRIKSCLFFIPPQSSIKAARSWREEYMAIRHGYLTTARCALFQLPDPPTDSFA